MRTRRKWISSFESLLETALHTSKLPGVKVLDSFDFAFQPSIDRTQILSLHQLGFLDRKENVIFLGPAGVGKTQLAVSLAITAAERGRRVYYGTLADLVLSLVEAEHQGKLRERLAFLRQPSLLIVDEIGYLPVTSNGANLFFQSAPFIRLIFTFFTKISFSTPHLRALCRTL